MIEIDGITKVFGLLARPGQRTLSPAMYNPMFENHGINAIYVVFEVGAGMLEEALRAARALGIQGLHLTCPYKEEALPFLDELSPEAEAIGAVNAVANRAGRLRGYNTDGQGYLLSLREELAFEPEGARVAILGAGGAARSIAVTLARAGVRRITLFNRGLDRGRALGRALEGLAEAPEVEVLSLEPGLFEERSPGFDLVVNATTASGRGDPSSQNVAETLSPALLPARCICSDINYFRALSPFLVAARARGLRVADGLGMLVRQGALGMRLLAGIDVGSEELEGFVRAAMGEGR